MIGLTFAKFRKMSITMKKKVKCLLSDSCACYTCLIYLPVYLFLIVLFKILFDYCWPLFLDDFFFLALFLLNEPVVYSVYIYMSQWIHYF